MEIIISKGPFLGNLIRKVKSYLWKYLDYLPLVPDISVCEKYLKG